jgi:hypothetical protein
MSANQADDTSLVYVGIRVFPEIQATEVPMQVSREVKVCDSQVRKRSMIGRILSRLDKVLRGWAALRRAIARCLIIRCQVGTRWQ